MMGLGSVLFRLQGAQDDVLQFIHLVKGETCETEPGLWVSEAKRELSAALIREEATELIEALERNDIPEFIDGCIDLIYVVLYALCMCGIGAEPFWAEVQRSNMAKAGGPKDPKTGKQLKPDGWTPPDIAGLLEKEKGLWRGAMQTMKEVGTHFSDMVKKD
jgi:phosphoribosyl-ATP pyrophosphohydrolase